MNQAEPADPALSEQLFTIKDCALITRMAGIPSALNVRELRERIAASPLESLYHHFCQTVLRATFDDPEFRNDLAVWTSRCLGDRILAERLGIINPYTYTSLEELREELLDVLDGRLAERPTDAWSPASEEFRFMQAATVVFDTGQHLTSVRDLLEALPRLSSSAIYYHFVEARRRPPQFLDDFSAWLATFGTEGDWLIQALAHIDFYFLNLAELKSALITASRSRR